MKSRYDIQFAPGQKVGLLGGSFNPAHQAHREISLAALRVLQLDKVVWLVSPQNPLKPKAGMAPLEKRIQSAQAVSRHKQIFVSRVEEQMGTSYTIDTLLNLKRAFRRVHFVFLLGSDNLLQLPYWHRWDAIARAVPLAVFARPGSALAAPFCKAASRLRHDKIPLNQAKFLATKPPPAWVYVPYTSLDLSSTEIRAKTSWGG